LCMDNTHCIVEVTGGPYDGHEYLMDLVVEKRGEGVQINGHKYLLEMNYDPVGIPSWCLRYIGMGSKKA